MIKVDWPDNDKGWGEPVQIPRYVWVAILLTTFVMSLGQVVQIHKLQAQVTKLTHACIPTYTGGGVWQ